MCVWDCCWLIACRLRAEGTKHDREMFFFLWSVVSSHSLLISNSCCTSSHAWGEFWDLGFFVCVHKTYLPQSNSTLRTLPWTLAYTLQHQHRPARSQCTGSPLPYPSHKQSWKKHTESLKSQQIRSIIQHRHHWTRRGGKLWCEKERCLYPFTDCMTSDPASCSARSAFRRKVLAHDLLS